MKTAVIYARYSSDSQTEQSIEGQLRVCEEYAKNNDILVLHTYIDRAMTGTNDNRPDFQRMIKDSANEKWDMVLVYKLDRFSRNKYETAKYKHILKENGVKVVSAMENIPDSPEGIILESVIEGMNQYYSEELSQKVRRGMRESRAKGNYTGGVLIYGYKIVDHKVVIDDEQAEVVRLIYEQYSMGVYVKDIIINLNSKGIYNKGKPFAKNTVYNILRNEKYSGIYRHGDEVFDNIYPQIVSAEIYNRVRAKIAKNKNGKASVMTRYLLKNKVICGYCGSMMTGVSGTSKTGAVMYYYRCKGKIGVEPCHKKLMRKDYLDKIVLDSIVSELSKPKVMSGMVGKILKMQDELIKSNPNLTILQKQKHNVERSLNNIMKGIEMGIMNNTTNKRMQELETQLNEIDRQLIIERSKTSVKLTKDELCEFYESTLRMEAQLLIDILVKKVVLYDDKIEIYFNTPINVSPDEQSGLLICARTVRAKNLFSYKCPYELQLLIELKI